jgi:hypothetical protein
VRRLEDNAGGARVAGGPAFYYLPHCEGALCDALLAAHWGVAPLSALAILGNSFSSYAERWALGPGGPARRAGLAPPARLLQLVAAGAVRELPVRDAGFHIASAFNDMALHVFPAGALRAAGLPEHAAPAPDAGAAAAGHEAG